MVMDDKHTSSVTWFARNVMSSTVMSAILLVSQVASLPVLNSIVWVLRIKGEGSKLRGHLYSNKQICQQHSNGNLPPGI